MSELPENNQEQKSSGQRGKSGPSSRSNPLTGSALFSDTGNAVPELLPSTGAPSGKIAPRWGEQKTSLLYNSPPPAEFMVRPFEQQHDRQTIYINARKAGALDALVTLVTKGNKTDLVDIMIDDLIEKYAELLQGNEELVILKEEKYRKKHNL